MVVQGAKFYQLMATDEENLQKLLQDKGFNKNRANKLSFEKSQGAQLNSEDQKLLAKMNAYIGSEKLLNVGPAPPANGSWETWEDETIKNPGTIHSVLSSMSEMLDHIEPPFLDRQELEPRRKNLEKYYVQYCKRLVSEGKIAVPDCDVLKPT